MILDNKTFGYTEFNLTDRDLFPASAPIPGGGKELGFVNITSPTQGRNSLIEYHEICVDFYVCGDPDWCAAHGGCDYLNCAAEPGEQGNCYLVASICDGWWEETGGGGGSGTGGGTGNTGGSGGGSGGSTPPDCNGPIQPFAGRSNLVDPCTGGWEPIPIDDEPPTYNEVWFNLQPNYIINLSGLNAYPCVQTIATNVISLSNSTIQTIQNIFSQSVKFNIKFEVDPNLNVAGNTSSTPAYYKIDGTFGELAYLNITIKLNPAHIANATKLSIAQTIIHEMIHAYFYYRSIEANGDPVEELALANELGFLKPYDPNAPASTYGNQHEQMAVAFVSDVAAALKEYKLISNSDLAAIQNLYPTLDIDTYYKAMAWGGLTGDINGYVTKSWRDFETNNPSLAQMYKVIITAEENATPLAASHEKCQ